MLILAIFWYDSANNRPQFQTFYDFLSATRLSSNQSPNPNALYQILDVVDGDTIKVKILGKTETVRMLGMDTPEVVDPRKPVQCFGKEASSKAKELLTGKKVRLETDATQGDRDKYYRLLRYVYFEDGQMYNLWMISNGYAHEYTYGSIPYLHQTEFQNAENAAREKGLGFWGANTCNGDTTKSVN